MKFPRFIRAFLCAVPASPLFADPFPLDSVLARGDSCMAVVWTPDSINTKSDWYIQNGSYCTGDDTVYRHCDFKPGYTYRSMAYSYGGEDPYTVFREKVSKGFPVGSHLCHYQSFGDPSTVIAGSDCSGFVCYLWNIPRTNTSGLLADTSFIKIPVVGLEPGDILVKAGSHAALVVDRDDSTHLMIWESTSAVNGCRERSIDISEAAWASYSAVRNPSISTAVSFGAPNPPRPSRLLADARWGSKKLRIRFERPFSGRLLLYDCAGKRIGRKSIDIPSMMCEWTACATVPGGIYCIVLNAANGYLETAACAVLR